MEQSSDKAVATSPQQPMKSQIPDIVKIGAIPTSTQMDVETSILEPVQHSQSTCWFVLENKGLLHSNSKLVFSVTDPAGVQNAYFPVNIGVFSLIKSARLMSGGKVLSEVQDQNVLTAYESMFISNEHNVEREIFSTGRLMNHNFEYDISASGTKSPGVIVDTQMDYNGTKYLIPSFIEASAESEFQINLSDLFGLLRQQQIPLYLMQE